MQSTKGCWVDHLRCWRIHNAIIGVATVFVAAYIVKFPWNSINPYLAAIFTFLAISATNLMNDARDAHIDRIVHPTRPIPQGKVTRTAALTESLILWICALAVAWFISFNFYVIAIITLLLVVLYNFYLRRYGVAGNLIVAITGGLPFIYGGLSVDNPKLVLPFYFLAVALHLARELMKDAEDIEGDRAAGIKSLPIISTKLTLVLIGIGIAGFIGMSIFIFFRLFHTYYFLVSILPLDALLCLIYYRLIRYPITPVFRVAQRTTKLVMLLTLSALYIGKLSIMRYVLTR